MIWHAIRVWENHEQKVMSEIHKLNLRQPFGWMPVEPKLPTEFIDGPRFSTMRVPIFPCYVFLGFGTKPAWDAIRRLPFVIGPIGMRRDGPPSALSDLDMARIGSIEAELHYDYHVRRARMMSLVEEKSRRRRARASKRIKTRQEAKELREALNGMPVVTAPSLVREAA